MPALPAVIDTLDKVAEPLRTYYEPKEGKFALILDSTPLGFAPVSDLNAANTKVVEFRDKNVALLKEVDELKPLKTKFEGIDPDEAKTAIAKVKGLKDKGVDKPDDIKAMIDAALKPVTDKLAASEAANTAAMKRGDDLLLRSTVGDKFGKSGGKASALDYIVSKAADTFEVKDGKVVAKPAQFSTLKPGEALGLDEWFTGAMKTHDFAFEPSKGSGAEHRQNTGGTGQPGQTVIRNPTPQQLGDKTIADGIKKGTHRLEYDDAVTK